MEWQFWIGGLIVAVIGGLIVAEREKIKLCLKSLYTSINKIYDEYGMM